VGYPLPVDLDLVDEALPQAPPMDLLVSRFLENLTKLLESLILALMGLLLLGISSEDRTPPAGTDETSWDLDQLIWAI